MMPSVTFVLGGAASGKSQWAEELTVSSNLTPIYVATSRIYDFETTQRVRRHQDRRDARWQTVEAELELREALATRTGAECVLIDCATMWLTNHMMDETDLLQAQERLLHDIQSCAAPVVIVSNEVGHGIVPANALSRKFREAQGRLNIALAQTADLAVLIVAGLPMVLKGHLP